MSQTPKSTDKVGRPRSKSVQKPKAKGTGKKTAAPTKRVVRPTLQLKQDVVEANQRPFGEQLPDLPPLDLEHDNMPLNPPKQPQDLPVGEENQQHQAEEPNQVPNPSPEPEEPDQLEQPNLPANQPNQPNQPPNPVQNLPAAMAHPPQFQVRVFRKTRGGYGRTSSQDH